MPSDLAVPREGDAGPMARGEIRFAGYELDLERGVLRAPGAAPTTLRPKTLALLHLLLTRPRRLVERDAIMEAVWPDVVVTDDSITQCIGEIRRALGAEGAALLRTIPRRGYILEADPETVPPPEPPAPAADEPAEAPAQPLLAAAPAAPGRRVGRTGLVMLGVLALLAVILAFRSPVAPPQISAGIPAQAAFSAPTPRETAERLYAEGREVAYRRERAAQNWLSARLLFERAIAADPSFVPAYAEAVFTYTNMVLNNFSLKPADDLRTAEALAERALSIDPGKADAYAAKAAVLRLQNRFAEALEAYRRVTVLDTSTLPSRANVGWMLVLLGRPGEALPEIRSALAANPSHAFAGTWLTYLGIAEFYEGEAGHGVEELRRSIDLASFLNVEMRQLYLAAALALENDTEGAEALVLAVRAKRPEIDQSWLRANPPSSEPAFLERYETFLAGLARAGVR